MQGLWGANAELMQGILTSQDAYMPKDASKQSHRGIGFVTFANSDSVEAVMSTPHSLNGQELAIDRATPKDKVFLPASTATQSLHFRCLSFNNPLYLICHGTLDNH